ncbi:MAG: type II secretion system F family protein [Candidatus Taylorbacteria bacterium]|nr:type II secretion system F family protein [Candidatus Taylorbacteria bacterium]
MNNYDQIHFSERLGVLLEAGLPLLQSIVILETQASKKNKSLLTQVKNSIINGLSLSIALKRTNKFGEIALAAIRVGESSGRLSSNLRSLAFNLNKKEQLKKKIQSALVYPLFISLSAFLLLALMILYIFPKVLPVFKSVNLELPLSTRIVMYTYTFLSNYWIYILSIITLIIFISAYSYKKHYKCRLYFYLSLLYIPLVSKIVSSITITSIFRSISIMLESGMTISEALSITEKTIINPLYKSALARISRLLERGGKISECLINDTRLFSPTVTQMIEIGETAGSLPMMCMRISDFSECEVDEITKNLSSSIEPLLMIIVGLFVGFIAVAIISPIYAITQNIQH